MGDFWIGYGCALLTVLAAAILFGTAKGWGIQESRAPTPEPKPERRPRVVARRFRVIDGGWRGPPAA